MSPTPAASAASRSAAATGSAREHIKGPLELLLGWRSGDAVQVGRLRMTKQVADRLRRAAEDTVSRLEATNSKARTYYQSGNLEGDEHFVADETDLDDDDELLTKLQTPTASLPQIAPAALEPTKSKDHPPVDIPPDMKPLFYAIRFAAGDDFTVFVNKADPHIASSAGRFYTVWTQNGLARVDDPLFQFRPSFELVVVGKKTVLAFAGFAFDQLFRDVAPRKVTQMVLDLAANAKGVNFTATSLTRLEEFAKKSVRGRNKLRQVMQAEHLPEITLDDLKAELKAIDVPEASVIVNDELVFNEERPMLLLDILGEDVWRGPFTKRLFASERKSPLG
jgi:hypothetical protein